MTYGFTLAGRLAHSGALTQLVLAATLTACDTDRLTHSSDDPAASPASETLAAPGASFSTGFRGGIPFGTSALPTSEFGDVFNGALRNIWPKFLLDELATIRGRGGKVVLMFAGNEEHYKDRDGHFDMGKWKARIDRFRGVDFSSFIDDGTIVGHYLIDEPYDPFNWHGKPVPGSVVEEMAKYSKQLWPTMTTIVRAEPDRVRWEGKYRYLDAAWAQYTNRKGDINQYIQRHVADARSLGLGLIVGLNITKGNTKNTRMTASQLDDWGSALLSSTYPCAFISWQYDAPYLKQSDIKAAMARLSNLAQQRPTRSCRASGNAQPGDDADDENGHGEGDDDDDDNDDEGDEDVDDGEDGDDGPESPPPPVNKAPAAAFDAPTCTAGVPCGFTDRSQDDDGTIVGRSWDFGTGTSAEAGPSITFTEAGSYPVTLTVTDDRDGVGTVTHTVVVRPVVLPGSSPIALSTSVITMNGVQQVRLVWSGARGSTVDLYRDGARHERLINDGRAVKAPWRRGQITSLYQICETGGARCSEPMVAPVGEVPLQLNLSGSVRGGRQIVLLTWSGAKGSAVEIYRDGSRLGVTTNDGRHTIGRQYNRRITYQYRLCEQGGGRCSATRNVSFR